MMKLVDTKHKVVLIDTGNIAQGSLVTVKDELFGVCRIADIHGNESLVADYHLDEVYRVEDWGIDTDVMCGMPTYTTFYTDDYKRVFAIADIDDSIFWFGQAVCSPEDEFDLIHGMALAGLRAKIDMLSDFEEIIVNHNL